MELGQITAADIVLALLSTIGGTWLLYVFVKKKLDNKNSLKRNTAGGDIAGGDITNFRPDLSQGADVSTNRNKLHDNKAGGDIAGGNIYKEK